MAAMTSFHAETCCRLLSQHEASFRRLCSSVDSSWSIVHSYTYKNVYSLCKLLTECTGARILSTDWTDARGTVATWRIRRQTRVVPIAVSALVPCHALAQVVGPIVQAETSCTILTWRWGAWFQRQLTGGSCAFWRAYTTVPGTSWWRQFNARGSTMTWIRATWRRSLCEKHRPTLS